MSLRDRGRTLANSEPLSGATLSAPTALRTPCAAVFCVISPRRGRTYEAASIRPGDNPTTYRADLTISRRDRRPSPALHPPPGRLIAVGTLITERPPHRSERAQFRHSAPTLGE